MAREPVTPNLSRDRRCLRAALVGSLRPSGAAGWLRQTLGGEVNVLNEKHRKVAVEAFAKYRGGRLNVLSHTLASLQDGQFLPDPYDAPCIYVLRLDLERNLDPSVRAIPNQRDENGILYIGGHPSGRRTGRFNALIAACRRAEQYFATNGHARNDTSHGHPVAGCLTTGLLEAGFHLSDCILDLVKCEPQVDELELLIGYQEKFYHLPPWNTLRGGASAFLKTDVNADASASISGFDSKTLCQSLESAVFLVE